MKRDLQFHKPYQILKSENYETFFVSKLLNWSQKWVSNVRHGNSLVVRGESPGRIIDLKLTLRRGHLNSAFSLFLLSGKKMTIFMSFRGRSAQFWLPARTAGAAVVCKEISNFISPICVADVWPNTCNTMETLPKKFGYSQTSDHWQLVLYSSEKYP